MITIVKSSCDLVKDKLLPLLEAIIEHDVFVELELSQLFNANTKKKPSFTVASNTDL